MKIAAQCDKCNSRFSVDDKFAGHKAKCPKCGGDFIVPRANKTPERNKEPLEEMLLSEGNAAPATGESFYSLLAPEAHQCPKCQKPLDAKAVICVDCGYDLRTGAVMQSRQGPDKPKRGKAKKRARGSDDEPSVRKRKKSGGGAKLKPFAKVGAVLMILAASVGCIWGAIALYNHLKGKLEANEAFVRLDVILSEKHVNAPKLARELPYIRAYLQQLPATQPKYVDARNEAFLNNIHIIPKEADATPLLEFPTDSPAYWPILDLLKKNTDLQWQIQKSCDPSETARHYGADLLMATLPFVPWNESDKNSLREKTDLGEKQRRFQKYADQSQSIAEKRLPGRYQLYVEATYSALKRQPGGISPQSGNRIAKTPSPVVEAIYKDKTWTVSFFGRTWTGPIEKFTHIDLNCPIKEHHAIFENLPFYDQLQQAYMHLRFRDDKFVVELEQLPDQQYISDVQLSYIARTGFMGFKCRVIRADK